MRPMRKTWSRIQSAFLVLCLTASTARAEDPRNDAVKCRFAASDQCSALVKKGEAAPFDGVLLTVQAAATLDEDLNNLLMELEEEKRYCSIRLKNEEKRAMGLVAAEQSACADRSKALQEALEAEEKKRIQAAQEVEGEKLGHILWAAGGVAVGVLAGALLAVVGIWYLEAQSP